MQKPLSILVFFGLAATTAHAALSFYALKDAYLANPASPQIYQYDGISNFRNNISASITTRAMAHGNSSDIAIDELGRFYFVNGDPSSTGSKQIWRWNSVSDWAINNGATLLGTRNSTTQISGFSVYQNEFYFFEGNPDNFGTKSLRKWGSANSWANGDSGTLVGSRSTGSGLGFEIDQSGTVWLLDAVANTATSGTLYSWASITDFINNTNGGNNGGGFNFFGGSDQIGGLAVVPEPSALSLFGLGLAALTLLRRRSP